MSRNCHNKKNFRQKFFEYTYRNRCLHRWIGCFRKSLKALIRKVDLMLHLTAKNFQIEVKDTSLPVIVMFYAIWCGKCAMMKPVVEDIEKKYAGKIKFCEVEIEESAVLAAEYAPEIVPTFVLFKDKKAISVMGGMVDEHTFESRMLEILS